jgi:hypothetical protein
MLARAFFCGLCALLLTLFAPRARAGDPAAAQAVFEAAKALADAGKWEEACPKFQASYELDRSLGTLLNLANCYEQLGKLAQAWARWKEALEFAKRDDDKRLSWIQERHDKVVPRLPKLVVRVDNPVDELRVEQNGKPVPAAGYGVPLAVDPGAVVVRVLRGEDVLETREAKAEEGKTVEVALDLKAIALAHPSAAKPPQPPPGPAPPVPEPAREPYDPSQRIAGFVIGGVGLAAVLVAGGLEIGALVKKGQADEPDACVNRFCSPQGIEAAQEGETFAEVGQWLGIAGIGVLAVGVTVLLTAPSEDDAKGARLELRPSLAGGSVGGAW